MNVAVGVNTINNILKKISETANTHQRNPVLGYTNHSLRARPQLLLACLSVPKKIIAERTGHRSMAGLRVYEKKTKEQEKFICIASVACQQQVHLHQMLAVLNQLAMISTTMMKSLSKNQLLQCFLS